MVTVLVALRDRLLVCPSDGIESNRWVTTTRLEGSRLECVAAAPDAPARSVVGTFADGLFRSIDGGKTFARLETGFAAEGQQEFTETRAVGLPTERAIL